MKHLIASIYILILVFCGANFNKHSQVQDKLQVNEISLSDSKPVLFSAYISDISPLGNTSESYRSLSQQLLPSNSNSFISNLPLKKHVEETTNNEIAAILNNSLFHVILFKGSDIVHPFHNFW